MGRATLARMMKLVRPPIEHACERCGSVAVTRDAWAEWNVADQSWVLAETFDFAFCHECHRETRLVERPA